MSQRFDPFQLPESTAVAQSPAATIYTHPDDVVSDPELTTAEKRAVLASWISDARAVENAPALRRLDSGAVVEVDAIRRALMLLDGSTTNQTGPDWPSLSRRGRGVISRWLSVAKPPNSSNDDDDDPPPAPAGFGIPFRPTFVAGHGDPPLLRSASATRMRGMETPSPLAGKGTRRAVTHVR